MRRSEADRNAAFMRQRVVSKKSVLRSTAFQRFQRLLLDSARSSAIISLKPNFCICEQATNGVSFSRLGHIKREFLPPLSPNFHTLWHELPGQCECRGPEH